MIVDQDFTELASVTPTCGTVVGFTGGTYHGVKSIKKGAPSAATCCMKQNATKTTKRHIINARLKPSSMFYKLNNVELTNTIYLMLLNVFLLKFNEINQKFLKADSKNEC